MFYIAIVFVAVLAFLCARWSFRLEARSVELEGRERAVKERESFVNERFLAVARMDDEYMKFKAYYVITESDWQKYDGEGEIYRAAQASMAKTIAYDIVHSFPPEISERNGKTTLSYKIRVKNCNGYETER